MPFDKKAYMKEYNDKHKEKYKAYNAKHKEKRKAYNKEYNSRPESILKRKAYIKEYRSRPEVKLKRKKRRKIYREKVEVRLREKIKNKIFESKPHVKRRKYLRKKLREAVIHQKRYISTIHKLIGCDVPTARSYLEDQFEDWMTWDNYGCGKDKWCIDHKKAVASIDIFNEEDVKRIFHYTNMQPMEFCKNSEKGCRET